MRTLTIIWALVVALGCFMGYMIASALRDTCAHAGGHYYQHRCVDMYGARIRPGRPPVNPPDAG